MKQVRHGALGASNITNRQINESKGVACVHVALNSDVRSPGDMSNSFQPAVLQFSLNFLLQCAPCIKPIWLLSVGTLHGLARALANAHDTVWAGTASPAPKLPLHEFIWAQVGPIFAIQFELIWTVWRSTFLATHSIDNLDLIAAIALTLNLLETYSYVALSEYLSNNTLSYLSGFARHNSHHSPWVLNLSVVFA